MKKQYLSLGVALVLSSCYASSAFASSHEDFCIMSGGEYLEHASMQSFTQNINNPREYNVELKKGEQIVKATMPAYSLDFKWAKKAFFANVNVSYCIADHEASIILNNLSNDIGTKPPSPPSLKNGDMEQGKTEWTTANSVPPEIGKPASVYGLSNAGHGNLVLEVDNQPGKQAPISQDIYLVAGTKYNIDFDYGGRRNFVKRNGIQVQIGNTILLNEMNVPNRWTHKKSTFTPSKTGTYAFTITPLGRADGVGVVIDNISLY